MVIEMVKGHKFSDLIKLADFEPEKEQGVYIIYYKCSRSIKMCYIGSSEDMSKRGFPFSHFKIDPMTRISGSKDNLYISVHYMPKSHKEDYLALERHLIDEYTPPCNKQ